MVRHAPDQLLHRYRRHQVLQRLKEQRPIERVVFVCHGNINRSAYAAAAFARALEAERCDGIIVRSAGFVGPGRAASELAQRVAMRRGIDLSQHQSRLIDANELRTADLIVVMSTSQRRSVYRIARQSDPFVIVLGDLDSEPIARRTVQDPYGHPEEVFVQVFDRIDRCIAQLVRGIRG